MISCLTKWWALLTYDGFKSHVNINGVLKTFSEERIKVGSKDSGISTFNKSYDKIQSNKDKKAKIQILELA